MSNRSKHLPYYAILFGCLFMSIGFNLIQYEEIKLLKQEKKTYRMFFEYLYLKLEMLEATNNQNFVYMYK